MTCRCAGAKMFNVILLDGRVLQIQVGAKATYYDVFEKACLSVGLTATQVFGLAFKSGEEAYYFVDLSDVVSKPSLRLSRNLNLADLTTVYLRVQYYVDCVGFLKDHTARHFYYQQLRENFVRYNYECTEERCFLMAAYALRADYGAYDPERHGSFYFEPRHYFPSWVVDKYGSAFITNHMPKVHADLSYVRRDEAKHTYMLELCSALPSSYNLHLYRLKRKKSEGVRAAVYLALSPQGLELFEPSRSDFIRHVASYPWSTIDKIHCEKQRLKLVFSQASQYRKLELYTPSTEWTKYLLWLIRHVHLVQMGLQKQEAREGATSPLPQFKALSDRSKYRESYIHSDVADLEWEHEQSLIGDLLCLSGQAPGSRAVTDNRVSVISNGSSNTTSGVVSDKLHISFDESDGDADPYTGQPGCRRFTREQLSYCCRQGTEGCEKQPSQLMRKEPSADSVLDASQKVARYLSISLEHNEAEATAMETIDSVLAGKPVQRATSDPNKQQADLARFAAPGSGSLCRARRAVSDDELVMNSFGMHQRQASEHIYENIAFYSRLPSFPPNGEEATAAVSASSAEGWCAVQGNVSSVSQICGLERYGASPAAAAKEEDLCFRADAGSPSKTSVSSTHTGSDCSELPPPPSYADAQLQKQLRLLGDSAATKAAFEVTLPLPHGSLPSEDRDSGTDFPTAAAAVPSLSSRERERSLLHLIHMKRAAGMFPLTSSASTELVQPLANGNGKSVFQGKCNLSPDVYSSTGFLDANQNVSLSRSIGDCRPVCPLHDHKKSHPDINKLRDMSHDLSLPLIAGLCNDKHLAASMEACTCAGMSIGDDEGSSWGAYPRQKPRHHTPDERPMSWHCGGEVWSDVMPPPARSRACTQSSVATAADPFVPFLAPGKVTRLMV